MWRQNRRMFRYESYNQPIYPMMGNFQNTYGFPDYQQPSPVYPQQQSPLMAAGGFYPYSVMPQNQYAGEQGMNAGQGYYNQPAPPRPNQVFSPFANPLQMKKNQQQPPLPYPNPYPKQSFMQKPQNSGFQSVLKQFKTQDGSFDINKMMNTAGQMMGTVTQVQSMFKGLGGLFKLTP